MRVFTRSLAGILVFAFSAGSVGQLSAGVQMERFVTPAGAVGSIDESASPVSESLQVSAPKPAPHYPYEVDELTIKAIKSRPAVRDVSGAKVIQASSIPEGAFGKVAAPALGANFDGFDLSISGYIPPDPIMAAGPNHLVLAVNLIWGIFTKTGAPSAFNAIQNWFAPVNTLNLDYSDPKVLYDQYAGRWIVMCIAFGDNANPRGAYFISVSDDANPGGTWFKWMIPVPNDGTFPDFPGVGFDASDAVYFTANHFGITDGVFKYASAVILKKSELYANNPAVPPLTVTRFNGMIDPTDGALTFTIKPSVAFDDPVSGTFLLNTLGSVGSNLELWRITDPVGPSPALAHRATIPIGSYAAPPDAVQPSGVTPIETNNSTIQSEVQYRNGRLYLAFPQAYDFGGGTVSAIRYLELDTTGSIIQNIIYGADGEYFFFPAPLSVKSGNAAMVFSHSSPGSFCGARYVGNFPNDMTAGVLQTGQGTYSIVAGGRNRWGDYGGIAQDPVLPRKVWMYHEYAGTGNTWRTRAGEITLQNHAPQISGPAVLSLNEEDTLSDTITVVEPDGETIASFALLAPAPDFVSFTDLGGGKASLSLTPDCLDAGVDTIKIAAADNAAPSLADTLEIEITVQDRNCRPVAVRSGPDTIRINQCQNRFFTLAASDPDSSGSISFSVGAVPVFASVIDSGNARGGLSLSPTITDLGGYTVQVFASDGQDSGVLAVPVQVFQRGDLNRDAGLTPSDVVLLLLCVFLGETPPAGPDACDLDGGGPSASDIVVLLNAAFLADPLPPC